MSERIYLDWNATAPLRPEARAAMLTVLDAAAGNPSSVHAEGRAARQLVENARAAVAALVRAEPRDVVFTSGGTEANAASLSPALSVGDDRRRRGRLLISAIEHPSVRSGGRFAEGLTEDIPVGVDGLVDLAHLEARLAELGPDARTLVSIMAANNETGVIQPVGAAADIVHAAGGLLHVDAVQAAGRIASAGFSAADLMTLSAHKLGGPKGVGAIVKRPDLHLGEPLIRGGGQERGARAGTENVAGIVGFGAAATAAGRALDAERGRLAALRDRLEAGLRAIAPATVVFGAQAERLPNTTLFAVPGIAAETALISLDLGGFAVSSGAACSSGKVAPSHVLAAMGVEPGLARGAIRLSLGFTTSESEIAAFLKTWAKSLQTLYKGRDIAA